MSLSCRSACRVVPRGREPGKRFFSAWRTSEIDNLWLLSRSRQGHATIIPFDNATWVQMYWKTFFHTLHTDIFFCRYGTACFSRSRLFRCSLQAVHLTTVIFSATSLYRAYIHVWRKSFITISIYTYTYMCLYTCVYSVCFPADDDTSVKASKRARLLAQRNEKKGKKKSGSYMNPVLKEESSFLRVHPFPPYGVYTYKYIYMDTQI